MIVSISFAGSFVLMLALERVINAISLLVYRLVTGDTKGLFQGYAGMQMLGVGATFCVGTASAITNAVSRVLVGLARYIIFALIVTFAFSVVYVMQVYYPGVFVDWVQQWNSLLGPVLHTILVVPLQIFDIVFSSVIPIFNAFWWLFNQIFYNVFVVSAIRDIDLYRDLGLGVGGFFQLLAVNGANYVQTFAIPCEDPSSPICYESGNRMYDLITPMRELRTAAVATARIFDGMCRGASGVTDMALYPFLDINLGKSIHNLANAFLFTTIQVPSITAQRCISSNRDLLMCLPDFQPGWNMLTAGLRNVGQLVDNWVDVSTAIIQGSLGFDTSAIECEKAALALNPANYSRKIFEQRQVATVGLTEGLYGVSDGIHVQYFTHYDSTESVVSPNVFPFPVDVKHGLAAVVYQEDSADRDAQGDPRTTIMGCR